MNDPWRMPIDILECSSCRTRYANYEDHACTPAPPTFEELRTARRAIGTEPDRLARGFWTAFGLSLFALTVCIGWARVLRGKGAAK